MSRTYTDDYGRLREAFTARGHCGWCASPFLRPVEYVIEFGDIEVYYCKRACRRAARVKRKQIRDHREMCPHPEKRVFLTETVALADADTYAVPNGIELRAYHCQPGCLGWHLTKSGT